MDRSSGQDGRESNLMKALSERSQHVVHLTHNDLDAAGGDAIHRMVHGDVFTIWASVGKFPALFDAVAGAPGRGDLLSISDLGCFRDVGKRIKKARSNGWRIEWRDHHRWRDEEIRSVEKIVNLLHVDTSTCATGIVARDLAPDSPVAAEVARVVCDYDLWKHEDPRSKVLGQVVMRKQSRDYVRDCLVRGVFTDARIEAEYAEILREMEEKIAQSLRHAKVYREPYRIVFAPLYGYPSETAHTIRDRLDTEIEVIVSPNGRFSIRSVPPISHLIAREFGGGGHPHAAGGSFDFSLLDRLAFRLLKKNRHYRRLVEAAGTISE
ncbi:phosphoesterase [Methanoculleus sp. FWC-SCC1]|uniref:Phosphoesterase n=1 Tax=Methanoculleus frigidifontis TaxID=2584085 RepID=A0ABT8MB86_9EURY|nr:phosphoesterase [Methanoculleus sp. FWC-SCC1]MDN7025195.1 phosphoesterase [Methanoculleus sp. FWC-SCC1]